MSRTDVSKWDAIYRGGGHQRKQVVKVLMDYAHLLPASGDGLDLACGSGANALFLVQQGLSMSAWDISKAAIALLEESASEQQVSIATQVRDVCQSPPAANSLDVIVVSYFLDRDLMPEIIRALKPGGLLYYQTFTRARTDDSGPRNPDYRLAKNELLALCSGLQILVYREEDLVGDTAQGLRNEAFLVGQNNINTA